MYANERMAQEGYYVFSPMNIGHGRVFNEGCDDPSTECIDGDPIDDMPTDYRVYDQWLQETLDRFRADTEALGLKDLPMGTMGLSLGGSLATRALELGGDIFTKGDGGVLRFECYKLKAYVISYEVAVAVIVSILFCFIFFAFPETTFCCDHFAHFISVCTESSFFAVWIPGLLQDAFFAVTAPPADAATTSCLGRSPNDADWAQCLGSTTEDFGVGTKTTMAHDFQSQNARL